MAATASRAIVQAPRSLPRLIQLPAELSRKSSGAIQSSCIPLLDHPRICRSAVPRHFEITGCYQFRVTRNSDLYIDDEDVDDLDARARR